ncbi:MAG TPA: hypothetical protein VHS52_04065 [Acidimicrobiales bacterium]|jgi:hypothetical protein|nr:hypothetical protein [Acidimicrobiales bacterium]
MPYTSGVRFDAMVRHLSVVAPPDSPGGRLHRAFKSPDHLDAIAAVEELRGDLEARQVELVIAARAGGTTWEAIGAVIGTSRQGAFNRFGALVQHHEVVGPLGEEVHDTDETRQLSAAIVERAGRAKRGRL